MRGFEWPEGAKRALNRLAEQGKPLSPAVVLEEAAHFARLEDTMPGRTGVFARASADAMELYDYITAGQQEGADVMSEDGRKGYQDQAAWLEGKSIPEAQQALDARQATLADNPYNRGGTLATADYIAAAMTRAIAVAASRR
jgi:hypothetical protein